MSFSLEKKYWLRRCGFEVLSKIKRKLEMRCFVKVPNTFSQLEWLRVSLFFFCVNVMTFMNESPSLYSQHFHHHVNTRKREISRAQSLRSPFYEIRKLIATYVEWFIFEVELSYINHCNDSQFEKALRELPWKAWHATGTF